MRSKQDRQANRTRQAIKDALMKLMLEKHYDKITVQDIIDRANVGRSTFYTHYRDKEDLFRSDWERFLGLLILHIKFENIKTSRFVPVKEFFQHLKDSHSFYRALVKSGKVSKLFQTGQSFLAKGIEAKLTELSAGKSESAVPIPILSYYLATEIFAILKWWLDNNMPYSPERMDEIFHQLVVPGFRQILGDESASSLNLSTS